MPDPGMQPGHPPLPVACPGHRGRARLPRLPRGHRAAAPAALSVAGIALLLTACSVTGTPGASSVPQGSYAALGDSYTAGPDVPGQIGATAGCNQSSSSYPYLVAQGLRLALTDMSCSSATVSSLSAPQPTGDGTNPAQLNGLSAATTLVTLGIGGNDVGWAAVITKCTELDLIPALIPGGITSGLSPCQDYYTSGGTDRIQQRIEAAVGHLVGALTQIRHRAPHARVFIVGYPDLLPASGGTCAHVLGITQDDLAFLNDEEIRLNSALRQDAEAAGDGYTDTYTPSVGHDACSPAASRWIEPLLPASPAAPLHPNAAGERGMARAVMDAITGTA